MKKLFTFLLALMASSCLWASITYELNGGKYNDYDWNNKGDMYHAILVDIKGICGEGKNVKVDTVTLAYDKTRAANLGIPTYWSDLSALLSNNEFKSKWGWLLDYMDKVCIEQGKTTATTSTLYLRFNLGTFFTEQAYANYPKPADFTEAGKDAAYIPAWGQNYGNPTDPTEEVTLHTPFKEGYKFLGWYDNPECTGTPITTVNASTTGTLYAKWVLDGIVYELNGGVWNEYGWKDKGDMYDAFISDWKAYSGSTRGTIPYEDQLGIGNSNAGIPTTIQESEDLLGFMAQEKWAWLGQFLDALATAQGKATMPTAAIKQMRFGLGNFFGEDNNQATNWVGAVDCSGDIASITAFAPYWGQTFPGVENPTEEITLNIPYKKGYRFDGWYKESDFSGTPITKVDNTFKGTLYAKWTQSGIVYELNGGVWNQYGWTSKKNMYDAFLADWKAYSGSTRGTIPYEDQLGIGNSNAGIPTTIQESEDLLGFMAQEKWAWLGQFLDALATAQGKATMPTAAIKQMRFGLGNFFGEDNNQATNWVGAVDCSGDIASITAFAPYWGQTFPLPTQPTEEVILTAPYKEGYIFDGWYAAADFSGAAVTKVNANTKGTLYAKWKEDAYTRDVTNGNYGTICLPKGSKQMMGAIFFEIAYRDGSYVYLDQVTELVAGMPYIFRATSNQIKVMYNSTYSATAGNANGLYGTLAAMGGTDLVDKYVITNNTIKKCLAGSTLKANRAYIEVDHIDTHARQAAPGRQRVAMGYQGENEATGVDNVNGMNPAMEGVYDVMGRKLTEPTSTGFYIINGKKVFVVK